MIARNDREIWVACDRLYTPFECRRDCVLCIDRGKISEILSFREAPAVAGGNFVYEPGAIVCPGFIDLHVHGARGCDVMDGTLESLQAVASTLAQHGTTAFLATTISTSVSDTEAAIRGFAAHKDHVVDGARPLGIHLEGPYLNPLRRGTHDADHLKPADVGTFRRFVELSRNSVSRITIAPEIEGGLELIREAVRMGIQVSMGHSDATLEQARFAVDAGARQATHTFNAMRPFHQRDPGILGLVLTDDRVSAEVIADGIHVHPAALEMLWRMKGAGRTLLISDGLSAVDMPDGRYPLGDKIIVVEHGECRDSNGVLAGSTLTLDRAVRNLVDWLQVPLGEAIAAASASPAGSMQMEGTRGAVTPGASADLAFLDGDLQVTRTMVAGRVVYSR